MIDILIIVGYIFMSIAIGRVCYSYLQHIAIEEQKENLLKDCRSFYRAMTEDELFEEVYNSVKRTGKGEGLAFLLGFFWPGTIVIIITGLILEGCRRLIPNTQSDKKMAAIRDKRKKEEEWKNALKQLEDAGIDTTELRKIKVD